MNEPEQNQPINPDEVRRLGCSGFVVSPSDQSAQPEFDSTTSLNMARCPTSIRELQSIHVWGLPTSSPADDAQQTAQRPQTNPYMQNGSGESI